ncbi:hypothetical protein CTEN210_06266 [Chaetoceros tenuissimus]|uniref:Uncharacterized protein n=1 Tax=Chaetoceros tenuissimus TaxID=426638 RepID=A0AAD3H487_9STRA|nr:hypothetical protein CTEN210_06266 [Chaetoceros tenuissimus]
MTPSSHFSSLTVDGLPRQETLYFYSILQQGFLDSESHPNSNTSVLDVAYTLKKAFHDLLLSQIHVDAKEKTEQEEQEEQDSSSEQQNQGAAEVGGYSPLLPLILELYENLKALIPNRKDLHDSFQISTTEIQNSLHSYKETIALIRNIAEKLTHLESQDRAVSTQNWLDSFSNTDSNLYCDEKMTLPIYNPTTDESEEITLMQKKWVVASVHFLSEKISQTLKDIADFQLSHVLAPQIHSMGKQLLLQDFNARFHCSESGVPPHTITWLQEIIDSCSDEIMEWDETQRLNVIVQKGWVDHILFRTPRNDPELLSKNTSDNSNDKDSNASPPTPFYMPEVFYLNESSIHGIRLTTQISVVGSSLALHASSSAGPGTGAKLKQDPLEPIVEDCRMNLIHAMGNKMVGSQEEYENAVTEAVVDLTTVLNSSILENEEALADMKMILGKKVSATMRGTDPVIKLLDNRMRNIFREMIVIDPRKVSQKQQAPTSMKSGVMNSAPSNNQGDNDSYRAAFKEICKKEFVKGGFSFYAEELAEAILMAHEIMQLTLDVHGSWLDKAFCDIAKVA